MSRTVRRTVPIVLLALAFALVVWESTPASGDTGATTSTLPNAGVLRLRLGSQDNFKFEPVSGENAPPPQSITTQGGCGLAPASGPLVAFSAAGNGNASTGFVGDAIGVKTGGSTGQPCGQISGSETLTMKLGSGLAGKFIDFAEIDLELKQQGAVTITGGVMEGNTFTPVGAPETYSSVGPDSGPDSGDNDNYRVRFPKSGTTAVNALRFSVGSAGSGSLEGGSDGTTPCDGFMSDGVTPDPNEAGCQTSSLGLTLSDPAPDPQPGTTDTLFHLIEADGVLDCGDTVTQTNNGITTTIGRGANASCTPIPYNLDASQNTEDCNPDEASFLQCIFFQKDIDVQQAQFFWRVEWAPEEGSYMEEPTEFDFGDGNGFVTLQLCGPSTGPVVPAFPEGSGLPTFYPTPSSDPWCVVDTQTELQPDGKVVVTEVFFGQFDPTGRR
jgi:hypothetical protein